MSATRTIAVLIGSLRKDSFSGRVVKALEKLAPANLKFEVLEIGQLPFFNQDLEAAPPKEWVDFRAKLKPADAVLFVTPEYNRSLPAVLKNALDVASRPYGQSLWDGKPGAVISQSPGGIGGFGANHHLRQSLAFLNVPILQQPEMYLGNSAKLFEADGSVSSDDTKGLLQKFLTAFAAWIETTRKG